MSYNNYKKVREAVFFFGNKHLKSEFEKILEKEIDKRREIQNTELLETTLTEIMKSIRKRRRENEPF